MPLDEKLEVARDDPSTSGLDWQPKYQPPGIPRLSLVVNSLLFELKKANIKWKRNLKLLMRRKLTNAIDAERHRVERILLNGECTFMLELGVQLSSIALRLDADPSLRSLSSRKSSIRSKKLLDLDDSTLLYVARLLDGRSLLHFSQACQKIRRVIAPNISSLKRMQSAVYDVFVDFNKRTGREDVRALRRGRTVRDPTYSAHSLCDLVPSMLCCRLRVHFGNNVSASNWLPAIHRMYEDNRIRPIAFLFKGGHCAESLLRENYMVIKRTIINLAHGRRYCEGADLRCFVEKDFIAFISLFVPHLQEVQLLTSRLFQITYAPRFLFSMINLLTVFGMTYEPVPIYYSAEELCRILYLWRYSARSHSCEVYIRRPLGCDEVNWIQFGSVELNSQNEVLVVRAPHTVLDGVQLNLHFH
ncbi:hypothetical protein Q1695_016126 [Nippostrongylus brasiliensis]|nr:hypothetical protein Q1695_016126 [Nippostrongylus brasiliensis]